MGRGKRKIFRTCMGCGAKKGKFEMIRFVSSKSGELIVDLLHRMEGRGTYLCPDIKCFTDATKNKKNPFSWKLKKSIKPYTIEELKKIVWGAMNQLKDKSIPARVVELISRCCALIEGK